jgi:hypothetical protein
VMTDWPPGLVIGPMSMQNAEAMSKWHYEGRWSVYDLVVTFLLASTTTVRCGHAPAMVISSDSLHRRRGSRSRS